MPLSLLATNERHERAYVHTFMHSLPEPGEERVFRKRSSTTSQHRCSAPPRVAHQFGGFGGLEQNYDPQSIRYLEATDVAAGWRCLEVGAGSGSIARWLAERVGPSGHVVATEIDPRFLEGLTALNLPNLEVQRHDIGLGELPERNFDLIHARLLLIHVPQRQEALARLVVALKPGGWLVIEDVDHELDR
jgi:SAM-dependent methyltransferase